MQGFNMGRYHPPSTLDTSLTTTTSSSKHPHPLGSRARKLPLGILTVRFEMPFAIWCSTCPNSSPNNLIGQGVRFNAEKKRVGNYFSTPIWSFRMKHTACGGWIEIRTDPKSAEYVVTEGARRRDYGDRAEVAARTGAVVIGGAGAEEEAERKRQNAFAELEGKVEDRVRAKGEGVRVEELWSLKERDWRDVDMANARLRKGFRIGRQEREREERVKGVLMDKMSLGIEIVEETEEDGRRAALVEFGEPVGNEGELDAAEFVAARKPLFGTAGGKSANGKQAAGEARRALLHEELTTNTRAVNDPFAANGASSNVGKGLSRVIPGVRRKQHDLDLRDNNKTSNTDVTKGVEATSASSSVRGQEHDINTAVTGNGRTTEHNAPLPLVAYDSE